ncbi:hypothetical protein [uncultured Mucilaginibacter sp.]|uniref:hypothetical protein n=1 Tax=uncultured Mucilaginibacter sp. TaxID=797541 RepID=UPI0025DFD585|nr:hypothetical protein [uncultured Mucilaginibacter sp.]
MRGSRFLFVLLAVLAMGCKPNRKVNIAFYYWKTVYKPSPTESEYAKHLHTNKMYVRIMDVDMADDGVSAVPVSPITFQQALPDTVQMVPVVYIINNVLKVLPKAKLADLAAKMIRFVDGKVQQAGKTGYTELQIDCDWTADTRDNYFYLLNAIKPLLKGKTLSVTLRLHQVKSAAACGIPPVNKALLMCYNMGNLRKYGPQNSIIDLAELQKYLGDNLQRYPMKMDIGLPLFSWAVAFRDKQYIGIARQVNFAALRDKAKFIPSGNNMYIAETDMPEYGLKKQDEVRWEDAPIDVLNGVAGYLSSKLKKDDLSLVYFHLDADVLKKYSYEELEDVGNILR